MVVGLDGCPEFVAMAQAVSGLLSLAAGPSGHDLAGRELRWRVRQRRAVPRPEARLALVVLDGLHAALKVGRARCSCPTRVARTRRASSMAVTPASTVSRPGIGGLAAADLLWSTTTSARPASPAASSRGSPRSGANQHCPISPAVPEARGSARRCTNPGFSGQPPRIDQDRAQSAGALRSADHVRT